MFFQYQVPVKKKIKPLSDIFKLSECLPVVPPKCTMFRSAQREKESKSISMSLLKCSKQQATANLQSKHQQCESI